MPRRTRPGILIMVRRHMETMQKYSLESSEGIKAEESFYSGMKKIREKKIMSSQQWKKLWLDYLFIGGSTLSEVNTALEAEEKSREMGSIPVPTYNLRTELRKKMVEPYSCHVRLPEISLG